jgi:hypothetical protein
MITIFQIPIMFNLTTVFSILGSSLKLSTDPQYPLPSVQDLLAVDLQETGSTK